MVAEILYEKAREYIGDTKDKVVFDLYSGTGTIAQILAPVAKRVVGVEIVEEAVEAAKENAKENGLNNCSFWAGDVLKVIDELRGKAGSYCVRSAGETVCIRKLLKRLSILEWIDWYILRANRRV